MQRRSGFSATQVGLGHTISGESAGNSGENGVGTRHKSKQSVSVLMSFPFLDFQSERLIDITVSQPLQARVCNPPHKCAGLWCGTDLGLVAWHHTIVH